MTMRHQTFLEMLAGALWLSACSIAPEDAPWTPLSLEQPIGWATRMKLGRLRDDPPACRLALTTAQDLVVRDAPDGAGTPSCPLTDAVAIEHTTIVYGQELAASCRLAAAVYVWEREVVQSAARLYFQSEVTRIDTFGTFACRNVYDRTEGRRSEHATANALDVAGFRLADGQRISVLDDWNTDGAKAAFLRDVRDGSCKLFSGVLSPEYNAAHANHFHLDMGAYRICS